MEEEKIDLPADNIEDKKEKIRKLVEEGYTNREIADRTGIPFGTVGYHAARFRKKEKEPAVDNSDRHLCKTCKFRSNRPTVNSCDCSDDQRGKSKLPGEESGGCFGRNEAPECQIRHGERSP